MHAYLKDKCIPLDMRERVWCFKQNSPTHSLSLSPSSQDIFLKPPYWDSGSLHSLLQGRRWWQIKLLVLFCSAGTRSTATWLKWWVRYSEGSCICPDPLVSNLQSNEQWWKGCKSHVLNSASVITCKEKKINYLYFIPSPFGLTQSPRLVKVASSPFTPMDHFILFYFAEIVPGTRFLAAQKFVKLLGFF